MSPFAIQVGAVAAISSLSMLTTYLLARKGLLSFRYAIGWFVFFSLGLFAFLFFKLVVPISDFLSVTPAAILSLSGVSCIVVICIQLSISISGLHQHVRVLSEQIAELKLESSSDSFANRSK